MSLPMPVTRRALLAAPAFGAVALTPACARPLLAEPAKPALPGWYADLERRTFNFFWERVNRKKDSRPLLAGLKEQPHVTRRRQR